eukprot:sb/3475186/
MRVLLVLSWLPVFCLSYYILLWKYLVEVVGQEIGIIPLVFYPLNLSLYHWNLNPNQDIDKKECYFWLFVFETFTTYFAITFLLCQRLQVLELFVIVETFTSNLTSQHSLSLCRGIQVVVCDMNYRMLSI